MTQQIESSEQLICEVMGWSARQPAITLLQALERTGSINSAAQSLGMQYKTAWQKIDQLSNLLPYPLVVKRTGGSGGGGSMLTKEGINLLRRIDMLQKEYSRFLQFLAEDPKEAISTLKILRRFEMKMSARNVWVGTVEKIERGAVNSVVTLKLKGGDLVSAVITDNSVNRLELSPGREAIAIVKASNVLLGEGIEPGRISARNILTGSIRAIITGAVNDEVTIDLPGGSSVTSIITSASVQRLKLVPGKEISAIIKASDLLLATA